MRKKKQVHSKKSIHEYWQSYSDMMAALLLMFILIMAATLYQSLHTYEQKNADLEVQRGIIEEQEKALREQEEALSETKAQLDDLSKLVGVKAEIIAALREAFANFDIAVQVDGNTGAITFNSSILFDSGQFNLKPEGQTFLREFIPRYLSVLLNEKFRENIAEIIIEGHTDTVGPYMYNLSLSQERAYEVASFCLDESKSPLPQDQIMTLRNMITANGRSFSDAIYNPDGTVDLASSRRVVFKFRLKDEEMISEMQRILEAVND